GQTIRLPAMAEAELGALAQAWGVEEAPLRAAAGSPWRLKQLLAGADPGPEPGRGALLEGLDPAGAAFLREACVVDADLPRDVLGRVAAVPDGEALEALVRRGLLE